MERKHLLGFIGPIISTVFVLLAVLLAPSFDWGSDPLSDLGHWFRTDIGPNPTARAFVFNSGLFVGGGLVAFYFLKLVQEIDSLPSKIVLLGPATTGLFLAGVGVFSETIPAGHLIAALGFFFSIPISAALIGLIWLLMKEVRVFGIVLLFISFLAVILFQPWTSTAVWEFVMAIIASIEAWFIVLLDMKGYIDVLKAN